MNNPQSNGNPQRLPDPHTLLKPEHVKNVLGLSPENQTKYHQGLAALWNTLNTNPPDSQSYQLAHGKLHAVTKQIRDMVQRHRMQLAGAQPNGNRPQNLGQQGMAGQQGQAGQSIQQPPQQLQASQTLSQNNGGQKPTYSAKVMEQINKFTFVAPPQVQVQGQPAVQKWIIEAKRVYGNHLHRYESALKGLEELEILMKQKQGTLTANDEQMYQNRRQALEANREDSRRYLQKLNQTQKDLKDGASMAGGGPMKREPSGNGGQQVTGQQEQPGQAHSVSSALDAARSQADTAGKSVASHPTAGHVTVNQQPTHSQINSSVKTEVPPPQQRMNSTQSNVPSSARPAGQAYPLTHETAVQQARSYSDPNSQNNMNSAYPQNPPQSATHSHPSQQRNMSNEQQSIPNTHSKLPIPKDLNIPPPQPVSMGQARPTMTNGPHIGGPIGQPVIQKHPGYVLEGEGERVLSKKRLEELVRQVTGSTGNDGDEGETMTAEVEETLLEVADNFVDQVIVSACKLAKLRNSSTLELRDLQLILERNYNIRVPGFASDEVRAVRKVVPTTAWTQKLSAIQAAKVTGGKAE
ncbi:uncharacterized protein KY384_006005 [Bacidia gigantensis]|uniref:uncharacterized protein n=1 Tax=Bacidia gigantensis TaxID=2732470 RepID=UPI001D03C843|nr:uncharacterized protein KY384_006005 [Bacidia gigantensis]KAG8529369.1 hypothetical protein KY384_006005 [Bacidia gigantensis]